MKCKYCNGNLVGVEDLLVCDKCGTSFKNINEEIIDVTCYKCGGDLVDGKCEYCETEIVIKDEDEEEALYCPDCGEPLNIHGNCDACGTKIDITFEG